MPLHARRLAWCLLLVLPLAVACGTDSSDDDDTGGLPQVDDDDDNDDDNDDNDDASPGDDDDDNDDASPDDDDDDDDDTTPNADCAALIPRAFACEWVIPGAEGPLDEAGAIAACEAVDLFDALTWECILDCLDGLAADCSNRLEDQVCIPLCVFHNGDVPDPEECTPLFPDFRVCAHRGAALYAPGNTVPAYEIAIDQGADLVEVDVRVTADGQLVCIHDAEVDGTTNGTGAVEDLTLAEIEALEVDDSDYGDQYPGLRIPTFAEALATMKDRALVDIDMKTDRVDLITQAVNDAGMHDQVVFFCSSTTEADAVLAVDPTFAIMPRAGSPEEVLALVAAYDAPYLEIDDNCDDPASIAAIHGDGAWAFEDTLGTADIFAVLGDLTPWFDKMNDGLDVLQTDMTHMLVPFVATLCQ